MENFNLNAGNTPEEKRHSESIEKILQTIKGLKVNIRDSYKKIKCSNEKEQDILNQNFEKIISNLNEIHKESFNLDDMMIWDSYINATDTNKMDELEKKTYDEFIYASQLARGKLQKIGEFNNLIQGENKSEINEAMMTSQSPFQSVNLTNNNNNIYSLRKDSEMDID